MTPDYTWHVRSYLAGMGHEPRRFVHYVQRYASPEEVGRRSGFVSLKSWTDGEEAEKAAAEANAGNPPFAFRLGNF